MDIGGVEKARMRPSRGTRAQCRPPLASYAQLIRNALAVRRVICCISFAHQSLLGDTVEIALHSTLLRDSGFGMSTSSVFQLGHRAVVDPPWNRSTGITTSQHKGLSVRGETGEHYHPCFPLLCACNLI